MIELGQFDVNFPSRMTIIGQALADFIAEFAYASAAEVVGMTDSAEVVNAVEARDKEGSALTKEETPQWTSM